MQENKKNCNTPSNGEVGQAIFPPSPASRFTPHEASPRNYLKHIGKSLRPCAVSPFAADRISNETISHTLELSGLSFSVNENTTRRRRRWGGGVKKKEKTTHEGCAVGSLEPIKHLPRQKISPRFNHRQSGLPIFCQSW